MKQGENKDSQKSELHSKQISHVSRNNPRPAAVEDARGHAAASPGETPAELPPSAFAESDFVSKQRRKRTRVKGAEQSSRLNVGKGASGPAPASKSCRSASVVRVSGFPGAAGRCRPSVTELMGTALSDAGVAGGATPCPAMCRRGKAVPCGSLGKEEMSTFRTARLYLSKS